MDKKKVFITIEWFDPAYKAGGPVISIMKLVENLTDHFDFYILTGSVDYGDTQPMEGIETDKWLDWKGLAKVYYLSSENQTRRKIFEILDNADADIYYVQGVFSLHFSIFPLIWWHQVKEDRLIIATRGMFHKSALSIKKWKKLVYLYGARVMGWFHHVTFHSTNPEETAHLKRIVGNEATYCEASNFPRILEYKPEKHKKSADELKLLCVARISPEKNSLFLLDVFQNMTIPVSLTVVGNYGQDEYFQEFKRKMEQLPSNIKVNYVGHKKINELQEYYDTHHVFILPTAGENYGHAIIEALSSGMPCIISKNTTPWNDLEDAGAGYNLESNVGEYQKAIEIYYKMDEPEFSGKVKMARQYAEEKIKLSEIKEAYLKLLA